MFARNMKWHISNKPCRSGTEGVSKDWFSDNAALPIW